MSSIMPRNFLKDECLFECRNQPKFATQPLLDRITQKRARPAWVKLGHTETDHGDPKFLTHFKVAINRLFQPGIQILSEELLFTLVKQRYQLQIELIAGGGQLVFVFLKYLRNKRISQTIPINLSCHFVKQLVNHMNFG